jgi:hypothetical protein
MLRLILVLSLVLSLVISVTSPAAATTCVSVNSCPFRVFNMTDEPLTVAVGFPDGHRCEQVVRPNQSLTCSKTLTIRPGQSQSVIYAPSMIIARHNDQVMRGNCQWKGTGSNDGRSVYLLHPDWKIVNPAHKWPCQIANTF